MRDSIGLRRVARRLLPAVMVCVAGMSLTATAQQKPAGAEAVKVNPVEAEKYVVHRAMGSGAAKYSPISWSPRGTVTLAFTVNAAGDVVDIVPIAGDLKNAWLINAAKEDLSRWQYKPYLVDGKATPMRTTLTFVYSQG